MHILYIITVFFTNFLICFCNKVSQDAPIMRQNLYIGGIFPMEGAWAGGQGCRPAVDMALEDVNKRKDILPMFSLQMVANDSKCMPGLGMNILYELLYNEPTKVMLLGPGCSVVSTFVGQAAKIWNLVVLSYGSSSPALSNRQRFPTFFRTHPSATLHNPTRIKLFRKFGWKRIAAILETQEVFTETMADLQKEVDKAGMEIAVRASFLTDPINAVRSLKRQDARIIVGLFYENMARRVFCEVYKEKLYGPKYVWFLIGWYADDWYRQYDPHVNCSAEQMKEALEGHFTTEGLMLNQDNSSTISGMTAEVFIRELKKRIRDSNPLSVPGYVEAPLAYDAVWALALALNKTQNRLKVEGLSLSDFHYGNEKMYRELYNAMNSTDFLGVSGRVAFNSEGDRIAWTQIEQMIDGNYTTIGFYDYGSDNLTWVGTEKWTGERVHPPKDRTETVKELRFVHLTLFVAMCIMASLGIIAACMLIGWNCYHKNHRYIRLSQPLMNNVMLIGCILCLIVVYLHGLDDRILSEAAFGRICQVRAWLLSLGFTLAYGSMFSKVWVVYRLTTHRKKDEIKVFRGTEMYSLIVVCVIIDVVVLNIWQFVDPMERREETSPKIPIQTEDNDLELEPYLEHCFCDKMTIWLGILMGYKGIMLLFGILLAYETRNVKVKYCNDSTFVGMSIYNVVVLCIITAPVSLIISSNQDAAYAFIAVAILLGSFLSMGLIFGPKIIAVMKNSQDGADSRTLTETSTSHEEEERYRRLLLENEELKRQIAEREERVGELTHRLHVRAQQRLIADGAGQQRIAVIDGVSSAAALSNVMHITPN